MVITYTSIFFLFLFYFQVTIVNQNPTGHYTVIISAVQQECNGSAVFNWSCMTLAGF